MSKDKKSFSIVEVKPSETVKPYFINRFKTSLEGDFLFLYLAFNSAGQTLTNLVAVLPIVALEASKISVMGYIDRLKGIFPEIKAEKEAEVTVSQPSAFYGNHLGFAHFGPLAEIRLLFFSLGQAAGPGKEVKLEAKPILLLEMSVANQMGIINSLYFR